MIAVEFLAKSRLALLVVVAGLGVAYLAAQSWRRKAAVRFTELDLLDEVAPNRPGWRRHVVAGLTLLGLAAAVVAVARPVTRTTERTRSEGRIMLLFDVSLSMQADDVRPSRIEAAQEAARTFVDQVAPDIEIGLISFARSAITEVDPTTNRDSLVRGIDGLQLAEYTAIGDAVASATKTLQAMADDGQDGNGDTPTGDDGRPPGAIVLLSDGETTIGLPTAEGGQIAAKANVPVFTISFGTPDGTITDPATGQVLDVSVQPEPLRDLAEATGGESYEAATETELADAYDRIQDLLQVTLGEEIERIDEHTWVWAMFSMLLVMGGWLLSLWWLRGML